MNRAVNTMAALALPVLGLAALWGWTHTRAQQGTEWDVTVQGYDPRDLLRGHYIRYRYDWPGAEGVSDIFDRACIEGTPPAITRVHVDFDPNCRYPLRVTPIEGRPDAGLSAGQLYVPQTQAAELERKLRDPKLQGVVRIRVRDDGHITPLSISFRPRAEASPAP